MIKSLVMAWLVVIMLAIVTHEAQAEEVSEQEARHTTMLSSVYQSWLGCAAVLGEDQCRVVIMTQAQWEQYLELLEQYKETLARIQTWEDKT